MRWNGLKKYKVFHWAYNLLHYRSLSHNKAAYRKYHLHKPVIASLSSKDFPDKESKAWLDLGDSRELLPQRTELVQFSQGVQESLLKWSKKGYLIIDGFFDAGLADRVQAEVERLVA
ncbi:MAG TPA: hypothetical protein VI233_06925, partial [Puia sp.]